MRRHAYFRRIPSDQRKLLDLMFRMSYLEGAAGLTPGTWSKNPRQSVARAQQWFTDHKISMAPGWFDRDSEDWALGLDSRVRGVVSRFSEKLNTAGIAADQILTDLISGTSTPSEPASQRVFWSFGKTHDPKDLEKKEPDFGKVMGSGIYRAALQQIMRTLKRKENQVQLRQQEMSDVDLKQDSGPRDRSFALLDAVYAMDSEAFRKLVESFAAKYAEREFPLSAGTRGRPLDPSLSHLSMGEVDRFTFNRFVHYLMDPSLQEREKGKLTMEPIRTRVQSDVLRMFDPDGKLSADASAKLIRRIYRVLGSEDPTTGLPEKVMDAVKQLQQTPAVKEILRKYQEAKSAPQRLARLVGASMLGKMGFLGQLLVSL